jgi:hypothetical protein
LGLEKVKVVEIDRYVINCEELKNMRLKVKGMGKKLEMLEMQLGLRNFFSHYDYDYDYKEGQANNRISPELMSKFRNAKDFLIQMTNRAYKKRPDCQQILENKHIWALNREEFNAEQELRFVEENESNNPYVYSMIITKLRK